MTFAELFTAVAKAAADAIDAARAADPELDAKIDAFIEGADGAAMRAVFDINPRRAFRVEVLRQRGDAVDGFVLSQIAPNDSAPSTTAH